MSRRDFLRLAGAGLAGVASLGISSPALGETMKSAHRLGIKPGNSATHNRKALIRALTNSSVSVHFPPGDYPVDNSTEFAINGFTGKMTFDPQARIIYQTLTKVGMIFAGGTGAIIDGFNVAYISLPTSRSATQGALGFDGTTDTHVRNCRVYGSAGAGILFWFCVRPSVETAQIKKTMADGLHFANCQDAKANDVLTEDTGDDGVAFVNYGDGPDHSGGQATNVTVRRSKARGIAVVGQSGVLVRGFSVEGTACSGLYCAYEASYRTRVPSNVRFEGGTVKSAGKVIGQKGNKFGIEFFNNGESVKFESIEVIGSASRGVSGTAPNGTVHLSAIRTVNIPATGFDLKAGELYLDRLTAKQTAGCGIAVLDSELIRYGQLKAVNTSKRDGLRRAFCFENNRRVQGERLDVVDTQYPPTGYIVAAYGPQAGHLGIVYDGVRYGPVRMENPSKLGSA
jgi:hypothetical protein